MTISERKLDYLYKILTIFWKHSLELLSLKMEQQENQKLKSVNLSFVVSQENLLKSKALGKLYQLENVDLSVLNCMEVNS
ncbi:hypothetical protein C7H19_08350 [Aphanothece hegewaldii CCALA 016]|uniref:Uncharacterized protein n=1 Tax=Aphanothece hegewaldii CCALA 016 TaxID=2107694 RepID=A0A2T1LZZ9_9CHRO|nr:hypothetical protein C7H19_08350 [Aphanothece hegewaldii CCALA 016]